MSQEFSGTSSYKCIYVMTIPDKAHDGLVKIGDATVKTPKGPVELVPNCHELKQAANERIKSYTNTAGIPFKLLHVELAVRKSPKDGSSESFRDHRVQDVLKSSGYPKIKVDGTTGAEWFKADLGTAIAAIAAFKAGKANLSDSHYEKLDPIILRPEQEDAVSKTVKRFKSGGNRMLWNAKMRFGKTLSALEVVRRLRFKSTIIITHRPVVDEGWYDDFRKIFQDDPYGYIYGSKAKGYTARELMDTGKPFVYFASMQDLRGSEQVGGKYAKNDTVFGITWHCVIIDEAHEGTKTALGDETIKAIIKDNVDTKVLALSGTPFNIFNDYEQTEIYTWDYVMEQKAKEEWPLLHFGDSNPYEELPKLRIYTYDLGDILGMPQYQDVMDKAFNFAEFFRVWTGDEKRDGAPLPAAANVGDFVHEQDVKSFVSLLTRDDSKSAYPFSTPEYRDMFRHTFWLLPGVRQALALQKLLQAHPVFGSGAFEIVNVAGDGDPEDPTGESLSAVHEAIEAAGEDGYTITLSCGKLTTGVTVKEWTAVLMLAGTYSTSAARYLQTIFRAQSPCNAYGRMKDVCYTFDFAPDRTLKMVADAVAVSSKVGGGSGSDHAVLGRFLNFCPVIGVSGSKMEELNAGRLLQELKRAYADRAVRNGFEDASLYNEELLKLDDIDVQEFADLKAKIGAAQASKKMDDITVNDQGLTEEEHETVQRLKKKKKKDLTPEEIEILEKLKEAKKRRKEAISILTQISVRMPMLIYGADVPYGDDITLDEFVKLVDAKSWEEFMPDGVTKRVFSKFKKFYDEDVFIAAGRRIRSIALNADSLSPTERTKEIAHLFSYFKNPDKETVLTPWRVVNMHMSDCIGGWDFWNEGHLAVLDEPRYVYQGQVTDDVFEDPDSKVLEINSKTGLYPLYMAYSLYRQAACDACAGEPAAEQISLWDEGARAFSPEPDDLEERRRIWNHVIAECVFVVCKTPMAKAITVRTLAGFTKAKVNAHYFDDLVNQMAHKPQQFMAKVAKPSYWKKAGAKMDFSAIVGNPPYQQMDGGGTGSSAMPIYQYFVTTAIDLQPKSVSMITPSRWFAGGKGLDQYRARMLSDHHISKLVDFPKLYEPFQQVKIRGGISYFLWERDHDGPCLVTTIEDGFQTGLPAERFLDEFDVLIRRNEAVSILEKVQSGKTPTLDNRVSVRKPFGIPSNFTGGCSDSEGLTDPVKLYANQRIEWVERDAIPNKVEWVDSWKVFMTHVQGTSSAVETRFLPRPIIGEPGTACTETYLVAGLFDSEHSAECYASYLRTRFVRFLVSLRKVTHNASRDVYAFVPDIDYDHIWTDEMLYERYGLTQEEIAYIESVVAPME